MPVLSIETLDDALATESCETFVLGQNSFTRASLLPLEQASLLENVIILVSGEVRKRLGSRPIYGAWVVGQNKIIQALFYFDTVSIDRLVAFSDGDAYYFDGANWQLYFAADVASITERIDAVQFTDLIYWTDSSQTGIRKWNGSTVSTVATSPIATILEVHTNRLIASGVTSIPDAVYFSSFLAGDTWDLTNGVLRVGGGKGDPVVAVKSWQETQLVVLCRQSTHVINADPLLTVANMTIQKVHNTIGCVSKRTACQLGQDMWFLSRNGVMALQKQVDTDTTMLDVPVSQPVQDVIQSIRWDHAYKSAAICYNNYYLLSVPVDSNEPDTVIAFHYLTGGFAVFKGWNASVFTEQPFEGKTRAVIGCDTGEVREWLDYLHEDDVIDNLDYRDGYGYITLPQTLPFTLPNAIPTVATIKTRGMTFGDPLATKMGWYLEVEAIQDDGVLDVYAILDGEESVLLRSYTFNASTFTLPTTLPFTLPEKSSWVKKKIPLHQLKHFYELQIKIVSNSGAMALRRVVATAMVNAYTAQGNN